MPRASTKKSRKPSHGVLPAADEDQQADDDRPDARRRDDAHGQAHEQRAGGARCRRRPTRCISAAGGCSW